jgi:hypothetical protein
VDTNREQEVLRSILSSTENEEDADAKAELRKIRQRRKMTATYKAHKALETLHTEQYERLFSQAYEALGRDERYAEIV